MHEHARVRACARVLGVVQGDKARAKNCENECERV